VTATEWVVSVTADGDDLIPLHLDGDATDGLAKHASMKVSGHSLA